MTTVDLEHAVEQLPESELAKFSEWFEHFIANQWDKKFENDVSRGQLDHLALKADEDFESGRCTEL